MGWRTRRRRTEGKVEKAGADPAGEEEGGEWWEGGEGFGEATETAKELEVEEKVRRRSGDRSREGEGKGRRRRRRQWKWKCTYQTRCCSIDLL